MKIKNDLKSLLEVAKKTSFLVGQEIKKQARSKPLGKTYGKTGKSGDLSKYGDLLVEKIVIKYLKSLVVKKKFDHIILVSEESGVIEFKMKRKIRPEKSFFLILDPIDGSSNMRSWHTPRAFLGLSIGLGHLNRLDAHPNLNAVEVGWIRDLFYDLDYYATLNGGAYLIDQQNSAKPQILKMSPVTKLQDSTIAVSLDAQGEKFNKILLRIEPILKKIKYQRRLGSTVLDLSKVACGEFDGFISISGNIKIHDIAAIRLIIEEAKGFFHYKQMKGPFSSTYLRDLILLRKDNYIKKIGFKVVATGTKKLQNEINKYLR